MNSNKNMDTKVKLPEFTLENREMILFDLLEGNFSPAEAEKVRYFIEQNEDWQQEWMLMESCVLAPDEEVVFMNKAALLKSEDEAVPVIIPMKRYYWVAAASIIFLVSWIVFNREETRPVQQDWTAKTPIEKPDSSQSVPTIPNVVIETPKSTPAKTLEEPQTPAPQIRPMLTRIVSSKNDPELNDIVRRSPAISQEKTPTVAQMLPVEPVMAPAIVEEQAPEVAWTISYAKSKLKEEWNNLLQPYSHPKLTFKRGVSKNNPVVWVTLSTQAYEANAAFVLKTNHQNP
jgi:hypothetical protein